MRIITSDIASKLISTPILAVIAIYSITNGGIYYQLLLLTLLSLSVFEISSFSKSPSSSFILIPVISFIVMSYPSISIALIIPSIISLFLFKENTYKNSFYLLILLICSAYLLELRDAGRFLVTWICITAILTDIGGFFFGKIIGGKKLMASVSPNKTWSGAIGGWILAITGAGVLFQYFYTSEISMFKVLIASFLMSISSQLGDLFESYLKRKAELKDSSGLLPGHGGVLDRLDSLIGATLFFMIYHAYFW